MRSSSFDRPEKKSSGQIYLAPRFFIFTPCESCGFILDKQLLLSIVVWIKKQRNMEGERASKQANEITVESIGILRITKSLLNSIFLMMAFFILVTIDRIDF